MTKIILICGKAEAGKTTAAKMLRDLLEGDEHTVAIVPYADYVKHTAKLLFQWDGNKDEAGRKLLQWWGTDVVRAKYPDFWAETVRRLVDVAGDRIEYVIVDDVRFPNEITVWDGYPGMTVRVERPGYKSALTEEQLQHISETALDQYVDDMDYVLIAENYEDLRKVVYKFYAKIIKED